MKLFKIIPILSIGAVGIFTSCVHDSDLSNQPVISFGTDIKPLIVSNCAYSGCHDGGGKKLGSLKTYEEIMEFVKANDARKSDLYTKITRLSGDEAMPPDKPLTETQIQTVYLWIMQGAQNN